LNFLTDFKDWYRASRGSSLEFSGGYKVFISVLNKVVGDISAFNLVYEENFNRIQHQYEDNKELMMPGIKRVIDLKKIESTHCKIDYKIYRLDNSEENAPKEKKRYFLLHNEDLDILEMNEELSFHLDKIMALNGVIIFHYNTGRIPTSRIARVTKIMNYNTGEIRDTIKYQKLYNQLKKNLKDLKRNG
jgi:hypothetical protein